MRTTILLDVLDMLHPVVFVLCIGYNVNLPDDKSFLLAPVVPKTQVQFPCNGSQLFVSNQLPQALVDVTGYGEHKCSWSAAKIVIQQVSSLMPAAGTIRAQSAGITCPKNMYCPPSPCTLIEMDYQNYYPRDEDEFNQIIGITNCGPVFGRGGLSGRYREVGDIDVLQNADRKFFPGHVQVQAIGGDTDLPGYTAKSQLIKSTPRYVDVETPVWSNIDGLGNQGTGEYDFVQLSTTRNPASGRFCADFRTSGYMKNFDPKNPDQEFKASKPIFNQTYTLSGQVGSTANDISLRCRYQCEDIVITDPNIPTNQSVYIFLRETQRAVTYECFCWTGQDCSVEFTADPSWATNVSVGTVFGRAHDVILVRSGKTSGNLPVRRVSQIDKTSEFECPSGTVWNVTAAGATNDVCNTHGYENHLLTCACFRYMLYRKDNMRPPDLSCCTWYTSPMVRIEPSFKPFNKTRFIDLRAQSNSDEQILNGLKANLSKTWEQFWDDVSMEMDACFRHDCLRDPAVVLLGFSARLAPCCPWFAWDNADECAASNECNLAGIDVGCTMTAKEIIVESAAVPNFADLCQAYPRQTGAHIFSQFVDGGSDKDFGQGFPTSGEPVLFGHLNRPLTNAVDELLEGIDSSTEFKAPSFKRVAPFFALNPGSAAISAHGEPTVQNALLAAFLFNDSNPINLNITSNGIKIPMRVWSIGNTPISAADPCWQRANEATLKIEHQQQGTIKEITIVVEQGCNAPAASSCTTSEVWFRPGDTPGVTVAISNTNKMSQPLPQDKVRDVTTTCQKIACNLSFIPDPSLRTQMTPTEFWNRYAVTTGVYIDEVMEQWAMPHASANASKHQYCRYHYPVSMGGWTKSPYPHTVPCASRCRPLRYRKQRKFSCSGAKSPVQQNPFASTAQDYHANRPSVGYSWDTPVGPNINTENISRWNPFLGQSKDDQYTVDASIEVCRLSSLFHHRDSKKKAAAQQVSQENCGDASNAYSRHQKRFLTQPSTEDGRLKFGFIYDFSRVFLQEGRAASRHTCQYEYPFHKYCLWDPTNASYQYLYRDLDAPETTGYSRYDHFCEPDMSIPQNPMIDGIDRFCELSVWTHEAAKTTDWESGACLQELGNAYIDSNTANTYTPGLILGSTYQWLGPRPRKSEQSNFPRYEMYNAASKENTARDGNAPSHEYPFLHIDCIESGLGANPKCSCTIPNNPKYPGAKNRNEFKDSGGCADNSNTKVGMYRIANTFGTWDKHQKTDPSLTYIKTTGSTTLPPMSTDKDQQYLQRESFENSAYACRCTKPPTDYANSWSGANTVISEKLNMFNNRPSLYIKCCATDASWSNTPPDLEDAPDDWTNTFSKLNQRDASDWEQPQTPKYRWVNYFDGWSAGTYNKQAQCGAISPPKIDSPEYMPGTDNKGNLLRPKLDAVAPRGFSQTPEGPQQFVVTGIRIEACTFNSYNDADKNANLRGPPLAPVSFVKHDEPWVPKDYVGKPYFVFEPNQKKPQMCDCGSNKPVFACERYTDTGEADILPPCLGSTPDKSLFDCVACGWTWPTAVAGVTFPLGLFLGSNNIDQVPIMERDPLYNNNINATDPVDFHRFFMAPGAPLKDDLIELITNQGKWKNSGDFDSANIGQISANGKVQIAVYPGTCLRPPYGRIHRNALSDQARKRYFAYENSQQHKNGGLSTLADETLYTYCEQPTGSNGYVFCENDPYGVDRETFCKTNQYTVDRIMFGHTLLKRTYACNDNSLLCMYIEGDPNYGTFDTFSIPPNATILISPLSWNVLSSVQCGESFAKLGLTGKSMSDVTNQILSSQVNSIECNFLYNYIHLNSLDEVLSAYLQILAYLKPYRETLACPDGQTGGPPDNAGIQQLSQVGRCFDNWHFEPTVATRNNRILQANTVITSLNRQPIYVPATEHNIICAVFVIQAPNVLIDVPINVNNTYCDSGYGGAAVHIAGSTAKNTKLHVHMESAHMGAAVVGFDESAGRLSRNLLDITGLRIMISGNTTAAFTAAISRVSGEATDTINCSSACNLLVYEGAEAAVTNAKGLAGGSSVRIVNVSAVFNQYALAPIEISNHYWAGKLREITVVFFVVALVCSSLLLINTVNEADRLKRKLA